MTCASRGFIQKRNFSIYLDLERGIRAKRTWTDVLVILSGWRNREKGLTAISLFCLAFAKSRLMMCRPRFQWGGFKSVRIGFCFAHPGPEWPHTH